MKRQRQPKKRTPAKLRDVLRRAWQGYEERGGIPHDEIWAELAKKTSLRKKQKV